MPKMTVKDNQWWFTKNPLPGNFQNSRYVVLTIEGRDCPMVRSSVGRDGRHTHSFKFLNAADRALWVSLSGQEVEAAVVESSDTPLDVDLGCGDDDPVEGSVPSSPPTILGGAAPIHRAGTTHFDAYLFADWSANSRAKSGRDSIWIADGHYDATGVLQTTAENPETRTDATARLLDRLTAHVGAGRRVLVGFDFPFGYPAQGYTVVLPQTPTWTAMWNYLVAQVGRHDERQQQVRGRLEFECGGGPSRVLGVSRGPSHDPPAPYQIPRAHRHRIQARRAATASDRKEGVCGLAAIRQRLCRESGDGRDSSDL